MRRYPLVARDCDLAVRTRIAVFDAFARPAQPLPSAGGGGERAGDKRKRPEGGDAGEAAEGGRGDKVGRERERLGQAASY